MNRPKLLDLFCGAGGAAMGYHRAGFDVVGVDINPQPHYPFEFIQADALEVLRDLIDGYPVGGFAFGWLLSDFDAIHASPPCQAYSWGTRKGREDRWPRLIADVREFAGASGLPYVIENVTGARPEMRDPILLCGQMFGLGVIRHRLFEMSDSPALVPYHPRCQGLVRSGRAVTVAGHGGDNQRGRGGRVQLQAAMGIDWMGDEELRESIPPAYTECIGAQLLRALGVAA